MQITLIRLFIATIRAVPKPIRKFARQSNRLKALNRYLVFKRDTYQYGVHVDPHAKEYKGNQNFTKEWLAKQPSTDDAKLNLFILCDRVCKERLRSTLAGLMDLEPRYYDVFFVCNNEDKANLYSRIEQSIYKPRVSISLKTVEDLKNDNLNITGFLSLLGGKHNSVLSRACTLFIEDSVDIAYVDTDLVDGGGRRSHPVFYPDWNPDLQLSTAYVNDGLWLRNIEVFLGDEKFVLNKGCIANWLFAIALEKPSLSIGHIPLVLLHKRYLNPFVFEDLDTGNWLNVNKVADPQFQVPNQIISLMWKREYDPLVSIIIPTKNGKALVEDCVNSIHARTHYRNFEILLVDNNSDEQESLDYFDELEKMGRVTLLKYPQPFNYSAINNFAVSHAQGEYIALVNNDIEVIEPKWLDYMLGHAMRENIGCVGAKLLFTNNTVQHAGVVMGYGGGAGHAHKFCYENETGYMNRLKASQNFSAVTAACLLLSKDDFNAVDGLDENNFTVAFNDVDLCLKVGELGKRNVYCAEAVLYHHESVSRGYDENKEDALRFAGEVAHLQEKWKGVIQRDPAYNPNLTVEAENFRFIKKPRLQDWLSKTHQS